MMRLLLHVCCICLQVDMASWLVLHVRCMIDCCIVAPPECQPPFYISCSPRDANYRWSSQHVSIVPCLFRLSSAYLSLSAHSSLQPTGCL